MKYWRIERKELILVRKQTSEVNKRVNIKNIRKSLGYIHSKYRQRWT